MRLFVAVELDDHVLHAAAALSALLRERASTLAPRARIGWVLPDRMHLTVRFIGHVDDERASRIEAVLQPPLAVPSFSLHIDGLGTFPPKGTPRVIWAGLREGGDGVLAVEREVTMRLQEVGVPPEGRPYSPHLTLARVRDAGGLRGAELLAGVGGGLGTSRVSACTLFESRLSPTGPTYVPLQRTALR